jgi:hypothetical protein
MLSECIYKAIEKNGNKIKNDTLLPPGFNNIDFLISKLDLIILFAKNINNIKEHIIPEMIETGDTFNKTLQLRKNYMQDYINEAYFKTEIQKIDKNISKKSEIGMILGSYTEISCDLLNRLLIDTLNEPDFVIDYINHFSKEIENLMEYINSQLYKISETYSSKIVRICSDYQVR